MQRRSNATRPKGEETRGVAAVNTAAECAGKSPPPEPETGSRDRRYGGGGNRTRARFQPPLQLGARACEFARAGIETATPAH
jgi:hypothetical protein